MILFLGDSFTWGQGIYHELWEKKGYTKDKWKVNYNSPSDYPHELLDYESDEYRKRNHFPALVSKHFNKSYNVKWGNGGSNWDIIHQLNVLPVMAPQFRDGLDLIVIQLTDWVRVDNRFLTKEDIIYQNALADINSLYTDDNWKNKLVDKILEEEIKIQLQKINSICKFYNKNWICLSWRDDMGDYLKTHYPKQYIPIFMDGVEYSAFEHILTSTPDYNLEKYGDGHFNSLGNRLIADSIIDKIKKEELDKKFNRII